MPIFVDLQVEINSNLTQHSSFPWQVYSDDIQYLEKMESKFGKAFIFFPNGFLMSAFDETYGGENFDTNDSLDNIPGLLELTRNTFTFRKDIR